MKRRHFYALVFLVLLINYAYSVVSAEYKSPTDSSNVIQRYDELFRAGTITIALMMIISVFDRFLWRFPLFHGWFLAAPNLNGTWDVSGRVTDLRTGKSSQELTGKISIEQSFFSIRFTIEWKDHGRSRTYKNNKIAVEKGGFCAFPVLFKFEKSDKAHASSYEAGVYFESPDRIPADITLRYSTSSNQIGIIHLANNHKQSTWKNLWFR